MAGLTGLGAGWLAGEALETDVRAHILKQVTGHLLYLLLLLFLSWTYAGGDLNADALV